MSKIKVFFKHLEYLIIHKLEKWAKDLDDFNNGPDEIMDIKPDTIIFPPGLTEEQKQNVIKLCKPDKQSHP